MRRGGPYPDGPGASRIRMTHKSIHHSLLDTARIAFHSCELRHRFAHSNIILTARSDIKSDWARRLFPRQSGKTPA